VEADIKPERFEVRQVGFKSRDGTSVTMFLVHRRGLELDGTNPVYLTGYGGFNISMSPGFSRSLLLWLEQGGAVAVPNLRGGGEYGETWHAGGMLGAKQNTFDDFIAAAEYLIHQGYTSPAHLAIAGGSNGGLLMGAVLTQRPDLFRAVVIQVPLLDMLRYHQFRIARLWIPEYGSVDDAAQFRWLRAYSPYHHVQAGVSYPAVLLATAESDTRVDPLHARKMAARLQAATASRQPVLLRLESQAGHGAGKPISKVLDELVDTWSFVFHELGVGVSRATKGEGQKTKGEGATRRRGEKAAGATRKAKGERRGARERKRK
jgi:prolyl oligopeptidase